jgi:hypothetical protein
MATRTTRRQRLINGNFTPEQYEFIKSTAEDRQCSTCAVLRSALDYWERKEVPEVVEGRP